MNANTPSTQSMPKRRTKAASKPAPPSPSAAKADDAKSTKSKDRNDKTPSLRSLAITRGTLNKSQSQTPTPAAALSPKQAPRAQKDLPQPSLPVSRSDLDTPRKKGTSAAKPSPAKHPQHQQQKQNVSLLSQILTPLASASRHSPISPYLALISVALIIRAAVGRHSWSGRNTPPMYGDFEAQRHWLEITWHLPVSQWYRYDLQYWGLDYPPLTACVSWVFGAIAHFIDPSWVALDASRGIESPPLVAYMRFTVLLSDLLIYLPACLHLLQHTLKRQSATAKLHALSVLLLFPGLVLIDHGHFQYNLIMLGLSMYAFTSMAMGNHLRSAVAFSMALLFKQMALYYALPVFVFLLSKCFERKHGLPLFISLGASVVATFAIHLYPFRNDLPHLAHRIFPVARGLYEDKVANMWCSLSPVLKLRTLLTLDQLVHLALATTLLASLPSLVALFRKPSLVRLLLASLAVSLSFFLFAFQVHEKSILLPLLPAVMLAGAEWERTRGWVVGFVALANYSMWPLLRRDGVAVPYLVLTAAWLALLGGGSGKRGAWVEPLIMRMLLCACLAVHVAEALVDPPARYPDLFVVANQLVSFGGFMGVWARANVEIWRV